MIETFDKPIYPITEDENSITMTTPEVWILEQTLISKYGAKKVHDTMWDNEGHLLYEGKKVIRNR